MRLQRLFVPCWPGWRRLSRVILRASYILQILKKVRVEVGHFYLTTTLINVGLGTATALSMWAWGMPTPYLWGALAAIANYIPYAGSATTLTVVAVVSFPIVGHVAVVAAVGRRIEGKLHKRSHWLKHPQRLEVLYFA